MKGEDGESGEKQEEPPELDDYVEAIGALPRVVALLDTNVFIAAVSFHDLNKAAEDGRDAAHIAFRQRMSRDAILLAELLIRAICKRLVYAKPTAGSSR